MLVRMMYEVAPDVQTIAEEIKQELLTNAADEIGKEMAKEMKGGPSTPAEAAVKKIGGRLRKVHDELWRVNQKIEKMMRNVMTMVTHIKKVENDNGPDSTKWLSGRGKTGW